VSRALLRASSPPNAAIHAAPRLRAGSRLHIMSNMKTIAVTIDETTLKQLDELTAGTRRSRSVVVRAALREVVERERRRIVEESERAVFRRHRKQLAREARMLIEDQARP
jgi:Arc/MetJ-type ribon-helix-helix transcriptional regulator